MRTSALRSANVTVWSRDRVSLNEEGKVEGFEVEIRVPGTVSSILKLDTRHTLTNKIERI
jgi:hypothetical protein